MSQSPSERLIQLLCTHLKETCKHLTFGKTPYHLLLLLFVFAVYSPHLMYQSKDKSFKLILATQELSPLQILSLLSATLENFQAETQAVVGRVYPSHALLTQGKEEHRVRKAMYPVLWMPESLQRKSATLQL